MAAKVERQRQQEFDMLCWEAKLIFKLRGKVNVPKLYFIGTDNSIINGSPVSIMLLELLGPSLEEMFQKCDR
jgi:hypothetical protein